LDTYVLVKCTHFIVWISDGHRGYSLRPISLCFALLCFALYICLSVAYIRNNSRTARPRKTKNWHTGSPRHTWLGHHFQGQRSTCRVV